MNLPICPNCNQTPIISKFKWHLIFNSAIKSRRKCYQRVYGNDYFFLTKYSKLLNTYKVTVKFKSCNMFLFFLSSLSMYDADRLWSMVNIWDISFRNSSQQPIYTIKSVNRTKLPCTVSPHPAIQHHSLFKNLTPLLYSCWPSEIQFAKLCLMMELTTGKNFCQNANISLALQVRIPD